jgi:hypothetical protein
VVAAAVSGVPPGTVVRQQPAGGKVTAATRVARSEPMSGIRLAPSILSADFAAQGATSPLRAAAPTSFTST